jgi:uncharacterized membrane protein (UPF0127 family)
MRKNRLVEKKTGRCLMKEMEVAETLWERTRGLIGRTSLERGSGLFLPHCSSIHMFFMKFAIDAVYVDRSLTVRKIAHKVKPWRLSWCPGAYGVIETPAGWAAEAGLVEGTELVFEEPAE